LPLDPEETDRQEYRQKNPREYSTPPHSDFLARNFTNYVDQNNFSFT
jgi:hypothetical protein